MPGLLMQPITADNPNGTQGPTTAAGKTDDDRTRQRGTRPTRTTAGTDTAETSPEPDTADGEAAAAGATEPRDAETTETAETRNTQAEKPRNAAEAELPTVPIRAIETRKRTIQEGESRRGNLRKAIGEIEPRNSTTRADQPSKYPQEPAAPRGQPEVQEKPDKMHPMIIITPKEKGNTDHDRMKQRKTQRRNQRKTREISPPGTNTVPGEAAEQAQ